MERPQPVILARTAADEQQLRYSGQDPDQQHERKAEGRRSTNPRASRRQRESTPEGPADGLNRS